MPFSSSQRLSANEGPKEKGVASGREFILLTTALMASSALAIDLMLPAFPKMREEYGMSPDSSQVSWVVTAFFLGLAVGPWLYGPASDKYGRRGLLFAGLALYSLGGILASIAPSWGWVIVARFIWGLGAAAARVLGHYAGIGGGLYGGNHCSLIGLALRVPAVSVSGLLWWSLLLMDGVGACRRSRPCPA